MAQCNHCGHDMRAVTTTTCVKVEVRFGKFPGQVWEPIKFGDEQTDSGGRSSRRCHDCNVMVGGYHHPGCDVERCPNCKGQIISCECNYTDEDDADNSENTEV